MVQSSEPSEFVAVIVMVPFVEPVGVPVIEPSAVSVGRVTVIPAGTAGHCVGRRPSAPLARGIVTGVIAVFCVQL